jgi:hypothetical protein
MDSQEKLERGFKAATLLNNEFFQECFTTLEARYIEAWRASSTVDAREDAHKYLRLIEWLKYDLQSIATSGDIEAKRAEALQEGRERMKLSEFNRS